MKRFAITILSFAAFAGPAFAQQATQPPHMHKMEGHKHMQSDAKSEAKVDEFATLDTDKDGFLSKAELAKHALAPHAEMVDGDRDGKLSKTEFEAGLKMIGK